MSSRRKKKSLKKPEIQNETQNTPEIKPLESLSLNERVKQFPKVYKILIVLFILVIVMIGIYFKGRNISNDTDNENSATANSKIQESNENTEHYSKQSGVETTTSVGTIINEGVSEHKSSTPTTIDTSQSYDYIAVKGNSFHFLVRRSMLNYIRVNNISIDNNQKIYAETNIVKEFGVRRLNIGESLIIPQKIIAKWVLNSLSLTESEKMAWRPYANKVNYNL